MKKDTGVTAKKRGRKTVPRNRKGGKKATGSGGVPGEGLYNKVMDEAEQLDFDIASGVDGIDDEIALLRVKIKSILENEPENIRLIMAATSMLAKLVKTRYSITREQKTGLKEAIQNVIKDIGIPLGIDVLMRKQ